MNSLLTHTKEWNLWKMNSKNNSLNSIISNMNIQHRNDILFAVYCFHLLRLIYEIWAPCVHLIKCRSRQNANPKLRLKLINHSVKISHFISRRFYISQCQSVKTNQRHQRRIREKKKDVNEHKERWMDDKSNQYFALKKSDKHTNRGKKTGIETAKQN